LRSITELEARHRIGFKKLGGDDGGTNTELNAFDEIVEAYGWFYTVKLVAEANRVTDDEAAGWNSVRFYNEIKLMQDMEKFKEFQTFINRSK